MADLRGIYTLKDIREGGYSLDELREGLVEQDVALLLAARHHVGDLEGLALADEVRARVAAHQDLEGCDAPTADLPAQGLGDHALEHVG